MGKSCKNCIKPNHFAKMCGSQQVNETVNKSSSSEEECNLIQSFDSCEKFEIMSVENDLTSIAAIEQYINKRLLTNAQAEGNGGQQEPNDKSEKVGSFEVRRNPQSHQIKALKALVRVVNHIVNMTIDTGSPVSFLNWTSTKQTLQRSTSSKFIPVEKLNLSAQFEDYNKRQILILRALKANLRSIGWGVHGAQLLVTERRMRCILGLDLQGKLGIHTTQKPAPTRRFRFDVLLCEQSEGWKQKLYNQFKSLFDQEGESKKHTVSIL